MLEIVTAQGLAADFDRLGDQPLVNGMLGVSLTSHKFSKHMVQEITELGLSICQKFCIIIFDYPERHNWPLKAVTAKDYELQCLRIGEEKKRGFQRMLRVAGYGDEVTVVRWTEITTDKRYARNLALLSRLFTYDRHFRAQVVQQLQTNLGGKIAAIELQKGRPLSQTEHNSLCRYLLEEIAGLLHFQFDLGYKIDIYPGPQMDIMEQLYASRFPVIDKELAYPWANQGWVQVR